MKTLKLALIGFGSAAQGFARLLLDKDRWIQEKFGVKVLCTAIAGSRKGALLNNEGIDLAVVLDNLCNNTRFENALGLDSFQVLEQAEAHAAIELSPLSIKDGQPAIDHIKRAFSRGMHVITANKGPIAWAFDELRQLAAKGGLAFLYETTVMDGAPVFNLAEFSLAGCEILAFEGILNTTTNFILAEIEAGRSFDGAVKEAQKQGFAEADPSMDIKGMDGAAKTCAIANALMGANLTPGMIKTEGIEGITAADLGAARARGSTIKVLCRGFREDGAVRGAVGPAEVPLTHPFATVSGTSSVLSLDTDLMGRITIIEHNPMIEQTAYGLYSDLLRLIRGV